MRNIPISLELGALYDKIVTRRRGGFCFELNGLFGWLLRELGFGVVEYAGRFLRNFAAIPMRQHRVIRATAGGADYLCDVGAGSVIPRAPLRLEAGYERVQGDERYRLDYEPPLGYILSEWKAGRGANECSLDCTNVNSGCAGYWRRIYSFTTEEQLDIDFVMPSYYCENHPDSYFRKMDMVHIFTHDGRKSAAGREIRIFTPKGVELIIPAGEAEYEDLLDCHFGIRL